MMGRSGAIPRVNVLALVIVAFGVATAWTPGGQAATQSASLTHAIEQRAEHDADELGHPDLPTALQLFGDNDEGLRGRQIAAIYDRAYKNADVRAQTSVADRIANLAPWLVALIAVLAFIFRDAVTGWVTAAVNAVGQRVWRRIAGNRMMRRTALRRYRGSVTAKMRQVRVIFRPNKPLDMARIFVPLKVAGTAREAMQDALQAVYRHRRIVVVGPPGSGKSILLRHLAYSYARADDSSPTDGLIPVWLELHRLSDPAVDPTEELERAFARNGFPNAGRFLERNLEAGRVLLLLDGLDEVQSAERQRVSTMLGDLLERFPRASAVITCRNVVYKGEFDVHVERTYELVEFNDQQVQTFLSSWAPEMPSSKSVEQLVLALRENPRLMVLARNPLMLTIVAHLYTESPTYQLPNSRAEFYSESSDILLRHWHEQQNRFDAAEKRAALRQLALVGQEAEANDTADRRTLPTETAVTIVQDVLRNRGKSPDDARPLLDEIVERSGLLLSIDAGERYQFAHLTFQEYFAAEKLLSQPTELFDRHARDADAWREVVKIWCGLVDNATDMVDRLWESGAELTALEALADARSVGVGVSDRVLGAYVARLRDGKADDAIERALGALAANVEARGRLVLGRLEQVLNEEIGHDRAASAARAVAASYLPAAAEILIGRYDLEAVRAPVEQLGDLAVEALYHRAREGDPEALESLTRIGTASAATAIAQIVWRTDGPVARAAAWRLASLLANPEVQRALADHYPAVGPIGHRWVWEPFARGGDDPLGDAVGRIADLVMETPGNEIPRRDLPIDPRIAFPLCAVGSPLRQAGFLAASATPDLLAVAAEETGVDITRARFEQALSVRQIITLFLDTTTGRGSRLQEVPVRYGGRRRLGSEQLDDRFTRAVADAVPMSPCWRYLFLSLPLALRLEAVRCAADANAPTRANWTTLNRPVTYSFARSWHCRVMQGAFVTMSVAALVGVIQPFLDYSLLWRALAVVAAFQLIAGCAWLFAGYAADEPDVLLDFVFAPIEAVVERDLEMASIAGFLPMLGVFGTFTLGRLGLDLLGIVVVWSCVLVVVVGTAARGAAKERAANNPFRGLELSTASRAVVPSEA